MLTISDLWSRYFESSRSIICSFARPFFWPFFCPLVRFFILSFLHSLFRSFFFIFLHFSFGLLVRNLLQINTFTTSSTILSTNFFLVISFNCSINYSLSWISSSSVQIFSMVCICVFCSNLFISFFRLFFYCNFSCKCEGPSVPDAIICPSKKKWPCGKDDW